jgi:uncharacterized membrane protein
MSEVAPPRKERLAFIDVLRGWAVLWMIETHVVNACLAEPYRQGWLFGLLELSNGFVAVTFLFCAGSGVWLAASRKADEFRRFGPELWKYLRRLGFILLLGYELHLPATSWNKLVKLPPDRSLMLFRSDILHIIALSALVALVVVMLVRRPRAAAWTCAALALACFLAAPWVWWTRSYHALPVPLAALFAPPPESQFPMLPWAGYLFAGAAATAFFMGARDRVRMAQLYIAVGLVVPLAAFALKAVDWPPVSDWFWWRMWPGHSLFRTAGAMLFFAALYFANDWLSRSRIGGFLQRCGQESLFIYFWHLVIVYGSVWNTGLSFLYQKELQPLPAVLITAATVGAMYFTAMMWREYKTRQPRRAFWTLLTLGILFMAVFFLNPVP